MITIAQAVERIRRIISGGLPSSRDTFRDAEILLAMEGVASALLKSEILTTTFNEGERIPPGSFVATFRGLTPTDQQDRYVDVALPMHPVSLPMGIGLLGVYDEDYLDAMPELSAGRTVPDKEDPCEYVPIPVGHASSVFRNPAFRGLLGRSFYSWEGGSVRIWQPTQQDRFAMRLVVPPFSFTENTAAPIPLPADLTEQMIWLVAEKYGAAPRALRDESNSNTPVNTASK